MIIRITQYIWLAIALIPALYGCQVQYEPLQAATPSLEAKMIDGAMATYWQANIEPAIQDQCIACHNAEGENDTNLSFLSSPLDNDQANLVVLLLQYQQYATIDLETAVHDGINTRIKTSFAEFETYAALYWNWQVEIDIAKNQANNYFVNQIENRIIQPVCTGCHVFLGEDQQPFAGTLSFYNYKNEEHGNLNSLQAMSFLINKFQADLIYTKALGVDHGGATVIRPSSVEADNLLQHSLLMNDVIQLINNPPY